MTRYFLFMILGVCFLILPTFAAADTGDRVCIYKHDNYRSKPAPEVIDEGVCVYEKPNFEGRFQCWSTNTDISDLSSADWKDKIGSVRVFGHARLLGYKDSEFRGDRIIIDHDVEDLSTLPMARGGNWNHEIRSLAVQSE